MSTRGFLLGFSSLLQPCKNHARHHIQWHQVLPRINSRSRVTLTRMKRLNVWMNQRMYEWISSTLLVFIFKKYPLIPIYTKTLSSIKIFSVPDLQTLCVQANRYSSWFDFSLVATWRRCDVEKSSKFTANSRKDQRQNMRVTRGRISNKCLGHYVGRCFNVYEVHLNWASGGIWDTALLSVTAWPFPRIGTVFSLVCVGWCRVGSFLHVNKTDRQTLDSLTLAVRVRGISTRVVRVARALARARDTQSPIKCPQVWCPQLFSWVIIFFARGRYAVRRRDMLG